MNTKSPYHPAYHRPLAQAPPVLARRPPVDKLNLSAEEKFDTLLLLIRSTDDTTLVGPAFEAARSIADETEKAQALLDIVKEIDYLSNPQKQAA